MYGRGAVGFTSRKVTWPVSRVPFWTGNQQELLWRLSPDTLKSLSLSSSSTVFSSFSYWSPPPEFCAVLDCKAQVSDASFGRGALLFRCWEQWLPSALISFPGTALPEGRCPPQEDSAHPKPAGQSGTCLPGPHLTKGQFQHQSSTLRLPGSLLWTQNCRMGFRLSLSY